MTYICNVNKAQQLNQNIMNSIEQLNRIKSGLNYVNSVLAMGGLQPWEAKEYLNLAKQYEEEIIILTNHIESNPDVFA